MYSVPFLWLAWAAVFAPAADRYTDALPPGAVARLGFVRTGSGSPLNQGNGPLATFSADGRLFATVCHDRIYLWDTITGSVRRRFSASSGFVSRLAFTADGKQLLAQGGGQYLYAWDIESGRSVRKAVEGMVLWGNTLLSPGGRWLIDVRGDVWDLRAGKKTGSGVPTVAKDLVSEAFTADERRLFLASWERKAGKDEHILESWDVAAGKRERTFENFLGGSIACSPDGRTIAASTGIPDPKVVNKGTHSIVLYDTETRRERLRLPESKTAFGRPVFSADGKRFAAVIAWEGMGVWNAATGKEVRTWKYNRDHVGWLTFSPDGKTIGVCGTNGTAVLWDIATGKPRFLNQEFPYRATDVLFSGDGKQLAVGYSDGGLRVWDVAKQVVRHATRHGESPAYSGITDLSWVGRDGPIVYRSYVKPHGEVRLFDLKTGRDGPLTLGDGVEIQGLSAATRTVVVGPPPPTLHNMHWQPLAPEKLEAARRAAAARSEFRGFRVVAPIVEPAMKPLGLQAWADQKVASHIAAVSPDGTHVVESMMSLPGGAAFATGGLGPIWTHSGLRLVDAGTGRVVREFPRARSYMAFLADGRSLVFWKATDRTDALDLVEAATGHVRWRATIGKPVGAVVVSPCGRWLAVTEHEGDRLHLLDPTTGKVVARHAVGRLYNGTDRLAFSPDSRRLAKAEVDGTVLVWSVPAPLARPASTLSAKELADAWRDLSLVDAEVAFKALLRLADAPASSVPLLRRELLREDDREQIERLIAGLDSPEFADRERSMRDLEALGAVGRPFLARALKPGISLEARTRLEKLLAAQADPFATPAGLRQLRAVEALERIGSADARKVLERLAEGSPTDDPLGREARATVGRLKGQ